ncbi:MAG: hypothetical protein N2234_08660, partial [Planctomycetota bacterium]|nr:hypothetical protein [Planctomycetota bacterium]
VVIISVLLLVSSEVGLELSPVEVAEIVSKEELLRNLNLAEEWEVAALMDFLESLDELELESE